MAGAGAGSQKLKELAAAMEKQDHDLQDALKSESKGEHVISMKGVGTFRVADGHDSADEQRRLLAKRSAAEGGGQGAPVSLRTIYYMVALAAGIACFLLYLLFGRGSREEQSAAPPYMNASELAEAKGEEECPDWRWIPESCLGSARTTSQTVFTHCKDFLAKSGYTFEKLKACNYVT